MNKTLYLLVGPPGSGKSTYSKKLVFGGFTYINQDTQGKGHLQIFNEAVKAEKGIVVDRMGFNKEQRKRYLEPAKAAGYHTTIVVFHESYETCLTRASKREDHPTIKDEATVKKVLHFFFSNYERVEDYEADVVERRYPECHKPLAVICDLDGTLCDVKHRQHFVQREGRKDWKSFFEGIPEDKPNDWCMKLLRRFHDDYYVVYCSGRGQEFEKETREWLHRYEAPAGHLFMRPARDSRKDSIVKEMLLDFEILTRFTPYFIIDDRKQVVDMWRKRGYTCLQCDNGDF